MASCVVIGQPLNFANIIALPLLFGIGVPSTSISSWPGAQAEPICCNRSLTRAIFFSALADRDRLAVSGHPAIWNREHGQTADDLARLDPRLRPDLPAGPDGPAPSQRA